MTPDHDREMRWYWSRFGTSKGEGDSPPTALRLPPGADLAALRRGAGREPGTVPQMWPFYRTRDANDPAGGPYASAQLAAEHACLVVYGFHQQSESRPVHVPGTSFAQALRRLAMTERFKDRRPALDAKVSSLVTATGADAVSWHLRSLVALLKTEGIGLDYSSLVRDLTKLLLPRSASAVRRSWGREYYWDASRFDQSNESLTEGNADA